MNPIASASAGLISAANRLDQASVNTVSAANGGGQDDLTSAIVGQVSAKTQFEASAKVLQVIDQTFKSTLNILV